MPAKKGDKIITHGRVVGQADTIVEIVEALGPDGGPPYRVRSENGHETLMYPGPDSVVQPGEDSVSQEGTIQ
ncbi:hypothetical protein N7471_006281 [Penicillium samsonianum]|uniref:uncharacterized protein n=1 Tax=Penicillium samsonianum TaxID=1882272 RepID=UPI00254809F9|nr:uncharacterized protein N7471_006281 [Penicillium samsonianum]KAJ6139795.1 hypothetical protein N7471_006281 [Penicillium samsonianum]